MSDTITVELDVRDANILGRALLVYQTFVAGQPHTAETAEVMLAIAQLALKLYPEAARKANEERLHDMQN